MIKLNDTQREEIFKLYKNDKTQTCYSLAITYNVSYDTINRILSKNGIRFQPNIDVVNLPETQIVICNDYKNEMLVKDIALKFNVSTLKIYNILKKNNIEIKHNYRKNNFNESFFTSLTPEMYYFYGFCAGDGSIQNDGSCNRQYNISIQINYKDILEKFCEWTDFPTDKISKVKLRNSFMLCFSGKKFILKNNDFFKKMGLVKNKTYNPQIPDFDLEFFKYFLIGLIDADGTIQFGGGSKGYLHQIALTNNFVILNWVSKQLVKLGFNEKNLRLRIYNRKENEIYGDLIISGKKNITQLVNILCLKSAPFFMKRKWNKILLSNNFDINYQGGQQLFSTQEEVNNVKRAYEGGVSLQELAKIYDCCIDTIKNVIFNKKYYSIFN